MLFFALIYIVEGLGQTGGLIAQPLSYFLKQQYGWTPIEVTAYLSVLNVPWMIKPIYGVVSDFIPLFGYRRKAYLIVVNAVAALAYFWVVRTTAPGELIVVLLVTAYAMAASSTLSGAVLVENGQRLGASDSFVNQEWLWFNVAAMASALLGGVLIEHLSPEGALHAAAAIVGISPLAAILGTFFLIREVRSPVDVAQIKETFTRLIAAFKRREMWMVGGFLFLYYFNPGFGTPLYYYMTDRLKFSQQFIGIMNGIFSAGWIVGALCYRWCLEGMKSQNLLYLSIAVGTATTLGFVLLRDETTALALNFLIGIAGMIGMVASLTLAVDFCPKRAEGFTFAALVSVTTLAAVLGDNIGAFLYQRVFASQLAPLIVVSAAMTAAAAPFVPLLRLGARRHGAPAA
jgi:MFS family permease